MQGIGNLRIALVGYGEVGGIFGAALANAGVARVGVRHPASPTRAESARCAIARRRRARRDVDGEAVRDADLVISAVTARDATAARRRSPRGHAPEAFVLDVNSASPRTKTECGAVVDRAGGRYVESAVMSSVPPHGIRVPMLLGGATPKRCCRR